MKILIQYEVRKILIKPLAFVSIAAILFLSVLISFSTFQNSYAFDN